MKNFNFMKIKMMYVLVLALSLMSMKARADALWVGQTKTCEVYIMGISQFNVTWTVTPGLPITLTGGTWATKTATVTQYFSGTATITCSYQYQLYYNDQPQTHTEHWTITCLDNPLSIYPSSMALEPGESDFIYPQLCYTNNYNQYATYTYTSIDPSVATVSSSGLVSALSEGTTNIIVYCNASANTCMCIVHVSQSPTSVSINDTITMEIGESMELTPVVYPSNAAATFTWHSSDNAVATVSSEGVVSGVGFGTAVVNCTTQNGITSNDCVVNVNYTMPQSIDITEDTCVLLLGDTHQLSCNVFPSGASPNVSWSSCDEYIVPVNSSGLIAGFHLGTTVVIATSVNGLQDTCIVEVRQSADSVRIRENVSIAVGAQYLYHPSFVPANGYANDLQWESEDESIATVEDGVITGVGLGSTIVKVYNNQGLYAESAVYVKGMNQVNVWLNSGVKYSYPIEYEPKITYSVEGMVYIEAWYLTATYSIEEVNKITIADDDEPWPEIPEPTEILENEQAPANLFISNGEIHISMITPKSPVNVYTIDGKLLRSAKANHDGSLTINVDSLVPGLYIIQTNNKSFKIIVP
jgi:uncharacterized protein YjdB